MLRQITLNFFIIGFCFLLIFYSDSFAQSFSFSNHIAFIKNGEVWISDEDGSNLKQITGDSVKVEDFQFSPSLKYLAYTKILKYVDEPGLWDDSEDIPQKAVCSIVIINLQNQKIIKEIMPTEGTWIYISRWLPDSNLLYYSSSGFDVSGFYSYDVQKNIKKEIDYNKSSTILSADYSSNGNLMTYIDNSGLGENYKENLHLVDLKSNSDKILCSKRSINENKISNNNGMIAFIEVEQKGKDYSDILWIYDIKKNSLNILRKGPANPKNGSKDEISWSPDDKYLGMFFSPSALVMEPDNPGIIHKVQGTDFAWIENNKIVFSKENNIYIYSLITGEYILFIDHASKPVFLLKKDY